MGRERIVPVIVRLHDHGRVRSVPVGQASVSDTEVVVSLEPLTFALGERTDDAAESAAGGEAAAPLRRGGRSADLEWLAERSRRVLSDPRKRRWHGDVRTQLAQIEAEIARLKERSPS